MTRDLPPVAILLVDDRPENLLALEVSLEPLGQRLVRAASGDDALRAVLDEQFAVILMDIRMPGLDGFETMALLKQRMKSRHTPIIFLTAYPEQHHGLQSYTSGAVDYILKPFDPDVLRSKVGVFVQLRQNELALQKAYDEVKAAHAELEQRVVTRTDELAVANRRIEQEVVERKLAEQRLADQASGHTATEIRTSSGQEFSPVHILVVDDNPANRVALESVLEPLGQRVETAASGAEALAKLEQREFALVLMDVQMPVLDGFKTVRMIRTSPQLKHLPVIFVTALFRDKESAAHGYALGAVDFLIKPYDPDIIRAKVGAFVALHHRNEKIKEQERRLAAAQAARDASDAASRAREEFVAILGHELRNPLHTIALAAERWHAAEAAPADCRLAAERILRGTRRMDRLIRDVLDVARGRMAGGIELEPEPANMAELARLAIDEMRVIHSQCTFVFDVEGDTNGRWDPHRVSQVVVNLLDNAVKHSGTTSGPVRLSLRADPDAVVMVVQNRGTPVPPGVKLFDAFERGARGDGLGLGLYIVDQIVRRHGGTIDVESTEMSGTTFTLRWPRHSTITR